MSKYTLSPQAQERLKQIHDYTLKNHGLKQKNNYIKMLRSKMREAAKNPEKAGKSRTDIKMGYYSIRAEKHYIYYRIATTYIDVIDILHESMEPQRHI